MIDREHKLSVSRRAKLDTRKNLGLFDGL